MNAAHTIHPIGDDEFSSLMNGLTTSNPTPIAVGVSGGADSMALVLLIDGWAKSHGGSVLGITVDHGLRKDSAAEASQVGAWLKGRGIDHKIIRWESDPSQTPQTNGLQARARDARYELMAGVCDDAGIKYLFVAHNLEDQAETFIMRLRHKSGLDGLGAMAKERKLDCNENVTLVRPLLGTPKARLKETLKLQGQQWVEDPSNKNTAFERVRTRELLTQLQLHEDIKPSNFAAAATGARAVRTILENAATAFIESHVTHVTHAGGADGAEAKIDAVQFLKTPEEIKGRVLVQLIGDLGRKNKKGGYSPGADKISRIIQWLSGNSMGQGTDSSRTLGGCQISRKGGFLAIRPEGPRRAVRQKVSPHMVNNVTHEHLSQKSP